METQYRKGIGAIGVVVVQAGTKFFLFCPFPVLLIASYPIHQLGWPAHYNLIQPLEFSRELQLRGRRGGSTTLVKPILTQRLCVVRAPPLSFNLLGHQCLGLAPPFYQQLTQESPSSTVSSSGKNNQSSGNYSIRYKRQVSKTIG